MKVFFCFLLFITMFSPRTTAQNNGGSVMAGALAVIGTGLLLENEVHNYREAFERRATQWVLSNKDFENKVEFDLDLIKWEIARKEDFNDVSLMGFKYVQNHKQKEIIITVCSPGWINQYGTDFSKIKYFEIDEKKWDMLFTAFLNLSKRNDINTPLSLESIPVESSAFLSKNIKLSTEKIENLQSVNSNSVDFTGGKYKYEPLGGNTHIVQDFDKDFMIDFNEGSMNLFIKSTKELVKVKRSFLQEANKIFHN
jgi:hypothetical protein